MKKKRIRKQFTFWKVVFGFVPPYKVLVDSQFLHTAASGKLYIKEEVPKLLQDKAYPLITDCTLHELRGLGDDYSGTALMAKRMQRHHCGHGNPLTSHDCLLNLLENRESDCFVVCAQNNSLREQLREVPGIPLIYISHNQLILEAVSDASKNYQHQRVQKNVLPSSIEQKQLIKSKEEDKDETTALQHISLKRKRAKAPNPLSVMKKQTQKEKPSKKVKESKSLRRKRKKQKLDHGERESQEQTK